MNGYGARDAALGQERRVDLEQGTIRYFERGDGPPVVFVHGVLTNAELWRKVVPGVADAGFRCVAPDWPFGSHVLPMKPDADLGVQGQAKVIADFLDALDLTGVTIVANDTGGALTQVFLSRYPDRVARVVLTPSDCFEHFFPPVFKPLVTIAKVPGALWPVAALARIRALQPLPSFFGWVVKRPLPRPVASAYLDPVWRDRSVRRDLRKLLVDVHPRHTLAAAEALRSFAKPVLLAWAKEDKLFPIRLAHRLGEVFPNSSLVEIDDSYTFVSEDQPAVLTGHIVEFAGAMAD